MIQLYPGMQDNPFGTMIVDLIRQNLAERPDKALDYVRMTGRVTLCAEDIDASVTLLFRRGSLRAFPGVHGVPDVTVRGTSEALLDLSRLPPRVRDLDPRKDPARSLLRALASGALRIRGARAHGRLLMRLGRLMSVY